MTDFGWPRLAAAVAEQIPPAEVDAVWVFTTNSVWSTQIVMSGSAPWSPR